MKNVFVGILLASLLFSQAFAQGRIMIPNGGERWTLGTNQWINWAIIDFSGDMQVQLVLGRSTGEIVGRIGSGLSLRLGNFAWVTGRLEDGSTVPARNDYIIRMTRQSDGTLIDASDAPFAISPLATMALTTRPMRPRTFKVVSPNGGEVIDAGTTLPVRWDAFGYPGVLVGVFVGSATTASPLASRIPIEQMRYDWSIPYFTAGMFRIRLVSSDEALRDASDNDFTIIPATRLTVLLPNGGERYRRGETILVRWRVENPIPEHNQKVVILLGKYTSALRRPEDGINIGGSGTAIPISPGEYRLRIPSDAPASNFYTVCVNLFSTLYYDRGIAGRLHNDESNACFIIE